MRRVVVTGATGETGRRVVGRLLEQGARVRVLARDEKRARTLLGTDIEVHLGDTREPSTLVGLAKGADALVSTIGTRTFVGANGGAAVDAGGTANLVKALRRDGLPHLVFLSAFGLDRTSPFLSLFSAVLNRYFHWKRIGETHVRAGAIPYTIVRPCELRSRAKRAGPLLNQTEPLSLLRTISRDLVADVLVDCMCNTAAVGRTFELVEGGREPFATQLLRMQPDDQRRLPERTPLF